MRNNCKKKYNQGFTLLELMVTIAIAAILLTIAIPNFSQSILSNRLTTQTNDFISSLNITKSEAIKRGVQVTMRRKGANASQWEPGWDIFVDVNANNEFNDDGDTTLCETNADGSASEDCVLKTYDALPNGFTLRTGNSSYKDYVAYVSTGMSKNGGFGDTFRLCQGIDTTNSRAITINSVGRAYASATAASCP